MVMPSDKEYQQTKRILQGKGNMNPDFKELADWIGETYNVRPINLIHDFIDHNKNPRLHVIFELESEQRKFMGNSNFGFDEQKQSEIGSKFRELITLEPKKKSFGIFGKRTTYKYDSEKLWVVFSSFEPIAKIEVTERIPSKKIKSFKAELQNSEIWEIQPAFGGVTFFVYTDEQLKKYESSTQKQLWTTKYLELIAEYDDYGYFKSNNFTVYLDSKENFDTNYESNWFYYYK